MKKLKLDWFLIETEQDYDAALARFKQVRHAGRATTDHREKLLLAHLDGLVYRHNELA